jgi:hypothetical protein
MPVFSPSTTRLGLSTFGRTGDEGMTAMLRALQSGHAISISLRTTILRQKSAKRCTGLSAGDIQIGDRVGNGLLRRNFSKRSVWASGGA